MKALAYLVSFTMVCGLAFAELPASAAAADITGTWELTIYYGPPDGDYQATYVLKQEGEKISGTYHGRLCGHADVTGSIKSEDVVLSVTVNCDHGQITSRFSGKVSSSTKMSGTVTFVLDTSVPPAGEGKTIKWSAEKKTKAEKKTQDVGALAIVNQYGGAVYYLAIGPGRGGGPVKVRASSGAEPVKRLEEGKPFGTTAVIADGASKSYSLEEGSYHVLLNFYKPGSGAFTGTERERPIVITAGQTRTLTITADGKLKY